MKFDTPATSNPIDQLKVVGKRVDRVDGPLKVTGTAGYANDRHDVAENQAHGYIVAPMTHGANARLSSKTPGKGAKVGTITKAQVRAIAEGKMKDLNAADVEGAMAMVEGSARSMGLEVVG